MMVLKVTPVRNVLIGKRSVKSERPDLFFNKVVNEDSKIDVYDVFERKQKTLSVTEINARYHRVIINNRKFYICSIKAG